MNKKILEILVDRQNEKGPAVFNEILVILHRAYNGKNNKESFSFEITKIGNRIRFFLICPVKYQAFLANQVYAHFNNVEILEVSDYLWAIPDDKISIGKISTKKHFFYSLKTFEDPGVTVWKWSEIDPFSSLTWALSKNWQIYTQYFSGKLSPCAVKTLEKRCKKYIIKILTSWAPKILKQILLHPGYKYLKFSIYPFLLLFKLIWLLFRRSWDEDIKPLQTEENIIVRSNKGCTWEPWQDWSKVSYKA